MLGIVPEAAAVLVGIPVASSGAELDDGIMYFINILS